MGSSSTEQASFLDIIGERDFSYNGACAGSGEAQDLPEIVFYNTQNDRFIKFDGNNCQGFAINKSVDGVVQTPWQKKSYFFTLLPYVVALLFWPDCDESSTCFDDESSMCFALGMPRGCSFSDEFIETLKKIRPNLCKIFEE